MKTIKEKLKMLLTWSFMLMLTLGLIACGKGNKNSAFLDGVDVTSSVNGDFFDVSIKFSNLSPSISVTRPIGKKSSCSLGTDFDSGGLLLTCTYHSSDIDGGIITRPTYPDGKPLPAYLKDARIVAVTFDTSEKITLYDSATWVGLFFEAKVDLDLKGASITVPLRYDNGKMKGILTIKSDDKNGAGGGYLLINKK